MNANEAHAERRSPVLYTRAEVSAEPVSSEGADPRTIRFIASTADIDGHGTIVRQNWQLNRFEPRGVVLYAHDASDIPIGTAVAKVEDGKLVADVTFSTEDLNPKAEQVYRNVKAGIIRGISAGFMPHTVTCETQEDREIVVLDQNELFELSVTPCPSNANALAQLRSIGRAAVPYKGTEPDDKDAWDAAAAEKRLRDWATGGDGKVDFAKYREGFAWYDAANAETFGAYKLPHHDISGGKLVVVRGGVIAAGNAMSGSRGGVDIPEGEVAAVKAHLAKHYAQFDLKAPWEAEEQKQITPPAVAGNNQPATREGAIRMSEPIKDASPTVARALGLPVGATESDIIAAATRVRELEVQLIAVTGAQTTGEALGSMRALKEAAERLPGVEKELAGVRDERDVQNFDALLQRGVSERKITPAEAELFRSEFDEDRAAGRGAQRVERLRGYVNAAAPRVAVVPRSVVKPSAGPMSWNGKTYGELSYSERARLAAEDEDLWKQMKADHEAAARAAG